MTTETMLTRTDIGSLIAEIGQENPFELCRAIEQAVLQSAEIQRLKAIETAAGEVLSMPREDGYIVLTVHLDALRAAMEQKT